MGLMKPLLVSEVPKEYVDLIDFSSQRSEKNEQGKSKAWVDITCPVCSVSRPIAINDVRNFVRGVRKGNFPGMHRECFYEGRSITKDGYVRIYVKGHPRAYITGGNKPEWGGYVLEHVYLMEQSLGRFLAEKETVHHINGNRSDNRIENLQLRTGKHGKGIKNQCGDCGSHNVVAVEI